VTYPHTFALDAWTTRDPRCTYTCACGAALNVTTSIEAPAEITRGDDCPIAMRRHIEELAIGAASWHKAYAAGREAGIAEGPEEARMAAVWHRKYEEAVEAPGKKQQAGRDEERAAVIAWLTTASELPVTSGREQDVLTAGWLAAAEMLAEGRHR